MADGPPFLVIGNPENRRVSLFQDALQAQGQDPARIFSHESLLEDMSILEEVPDTPHILRLDASGENAEVERALLRLGHPDTVEAGVSQVSPEELDRLPVQRGQILCPRQHHFGFVRYLRELAEILGRRSSWKVLSPPEQVIELFDKRLCSKRYRECDIPTPPAVDEPIESPDELREAMTKRGWDQVYVKLSCSSSASCLAVFRRGKGRPEVLMTTIRRQSDGWFNSLRVQRVDDRSGIDEVLSFLLREGSQIEMSEPKARLDNGFMDCRVLVVAGEPVFTVVRQSAHPITNLHLGGWRGDLDVFLGAVPPGRWEAALESCRRVAELHGCFQVGVDVMFRPGFEEHRILEANAFGDLLPDLTRDGLSVYEWQIQAALVV